MISSAAKLQLRELDHTHRMALMSRVRSAAAVRPGLVAIRSPRHLAACEMLPTPRTLLVYAVEDRRDLRRRLFGDELDARFRDRRAKRRLHWRF